MQQLVSYSQIKQSNELKSLFDHYASNKAAIKEFSKFAHGHKDIVHYFTDHKGGYYRDLAKVVFDEASAIKALNADFWSRVIDMSEILQVMPADKRTELRKQIDEHKTPDFTPEIVLKTIESLLLQRGSFMADKVDAIFRNLSSKHVTNSPMAFRERMIMEYVLDIYRHGAPSPRYQTCEKLNDLRYVIAQILGKEIETTPDTSPSLRAIISEEGYGQWYEFDGGAFRIKIFKKGTAHLEVHPEVALKLNEILATKYPSVIASGSKAKNDYKPKFETEFKVDTISFGCAQILIELVNGLRHNSSAYLRVDHRTEKEIEEARKIVEFLGGQFNSHHNVSFDFDVVPALNKIIMTGCLPEKKSHQFYPTPSDLAERVVDMADIKKGHRVLEPSAGQGALADLVPKTAKLVCVEISSVNAEILKTKGHDVLEEDFLGLDNVEFSSFDRVVMNPPFHNSFALSHIRHALTFLGKGGVLVAIVPSSYKDRNDLFKHCDCEWSEVLHDQFKDASISVVIVKLTKKGLYG
jgi:hypothetical protein